jgi:hypothetical protein
MSHLALTSTSSVPLTSTDGRAVEVVATFGDAVVGVRHVMDPRGGVVRTATKALLGGGAALLAASALAFGWATHVAAENADAKAAWKAAGKPDWAFRPTLLPVTSTGLDALALGGSVLGLGLLTWGLSRRREELLPSRIRLGTAAGVDFALEGVGDAFDLVAPAGDGFAVHVPGGATQSDIAPGALVPMLESTKLRFHVGKTAFHVASVPAPKKTAASAAFDRRPFAFFAASALVHLGLLAVLRTVPADQSTAAGDDNSTENALMNGQLASIEEEPEVTEPDEKGTEVGAATGQARMALESGTMGTQKDPSASVGKRQVQGEGTPQVSRTRSQVLDDARRAGILGAFEAPDRFSSITGQSDVTIGMDELDFDGGWDGTGTGAPRGFGNGPNGFGPGGGGNDWNSVWSGNYNTITTGPGTGDGWTMGGGKGPRMRRTPKAPTVSMSQPDTTCSKSADCDTSIIKRYIKRNLSKITYCYEKELLVTPGLSGTVDTIFTVMPNGLVVESKASGVSANVSSCVASVISNIKFPKFEAPFQVKYPFIMHRAGQ